MFERAWLAFLFPLCDVVDDFAGTLSDCAVVVDTTDGEVRQRAAALPNAHRLFWFHVGDETRGGHAERAAAYTPWHHVFRNYWSRDGRETFTRLQERGRLSWVPLGYGNNFGPALTSPILPSFDNLFAFCGNLGQNPLRQAHVDELRSQGVQVASVIAARTFAFSILNASEYASFHQRAAFCLNLPGTSVECFRFYEALESGCIPVVIDEFAGANYTERTWDEIHRLAEVLPITHFPAWETQHRRWPLRASRAAPFVWVNKPSDLVFIKSLTSSEILALKQETRIWWSATKHHFQDTVQRKINECQADR
jgi:Exostosin family